ncbi:MAG: glycine zipper family protein [Pseudomonadota bacterium]|nr:glycine zipper family protein [Pseudomonadota bacterium]
MHMIKHCTLIAAIGLSGCATQTGWAPTVDPYGDPHPERITADTVECKQIAQQAAGSTGGETVRGTLLGGAIGAAAGAAIGAAVGSPGTGAAIGAATGGIGSGAHNAYDTEGDYKRAYSNCMRGRGHNVIN